ncbi:MAG: hypothetical protein DI570_16480 [Phenylobacterium zucineum]|nr:MAG: hypothetical protein DI570_16480 [Phenylobacterium zucineum]
MIRRRSPHLESPNTLAFMEWFGIHAAPARILEVLNAAEGEVVPFDRILTQAGTTKSGTRMALVRMARAMPSGFYASAPGVGYKLTDIGLAECREALADAAARAADSASERRAA